MNIGDRIGDYEIIAILGAGGMGQVYKVRNVLSERIEAMKVLLPNMEGDTELADRFLREIKVQAALDHPNIAKLNTATRAGDQLVMIMEYVQGTSIEKLLEQGPMPVAAASACTDQILDALAYAHAHGVVHRDIKPANIMLTPQGRAKLMDFGIARVKEEKKLTQAGRTVGSLPYMSPEQIQGSEPDPRSDLYSLGVTLYEMVTGKRPFQGDSDYQLMAAHLQQAPPPPIQIMPGLPETLNDIILIAIAKNPKERFQSADAFRAALKNVPASTEVLTQTASRAVKPVPSPSAPTVGIGSSIAAQNAPTAVGTRSSIETAPHSVPTKVSPPPIPVQAPIQAQAPVQTPATPPAAVVPPPVASTPMAAQVFPTPSPLPATPASRRGLYMVLGSIATLVVLAAAIIEGPKFLGGQAGAGTQTVSPGPVSGSVPVQGSGSTPPNPVAPITSSQPSPPPQASPAPAAASQPAAPSGVAQPAVIQPRPAAPPVAQQPSRPQQPSPSTPARPQAQPVPGNPVQVSVQPAAQPASPVAATPPIQTAPTQAAAPPPAAPPAAASSAGSPPAASAAASAQMNGLREQYNLLSIRAGTSKAGLSSLEQQMARQGLGMRSDMKEAASRMDYLMSEAMMSIRSGDADGAQRNLQLAERAVEQIEKFLGRR